MPTEPIRRKMAQYQEEIDRGLTAAGRPDTLVRFVVAGLGDDDEDE